MQKARAELDSHGEPSGNVYALEAVIADGGPAEIEFVPGDGSRIEVVVWKVTVKGRQDVLLGAVKDNIATMPDPSGVAAVLRSIDGEAVALYRRHNADANSTPIWNDVRDGGVVHLQTYSVESANLPL